MCCSWCAVKKAIFLFDFDFRLLETFSFVFYFLFSFVISSSSLRFQDTSLSVNHFTWFALRCETNER